MPWTRQVGRFRMICNDQGDIKTVLLWQATTCLPPGQRLYQWIHARRRHPDPPAIDILRQLVADDLQLDYDALELWLAEKLLLGAQ